MEFLTILKIFHLLGLMAGLGGALYTDYLMIMRGILRPLDLITVKHIIHLSHAVILGLIILWVSGTILAWAVYLENPRFIENEKFWAKVTIVVALTFNGFFIHSFVLRAASSNIGKRLLFDTNFGMTVGLTFAGCLSFTSWLIPFILGSAPEFSYVVPFEIILAVWIIAILSSATAIFTIILIEEYWRNLPAKMTEKPSLLSVSRSFTMTTQDIFQQRARPIS